MTPGRPPASARLIHQMTTAVLAARGRLADVTAALDHRTLAATRPRRHQRRPRYEIGVIDTSETWGLPDTHRIPTRAALWNRHTSDHCCSRGIDESPPTVTAPRRMQVQHWRAGES
jgi:hypothetical protein